MTIASSKKEVEMNSIGDIMKGGISAILIAVGYVVLWCSILCLIWSAIGMGNGCSGAALVAWSLQQL